MTIPMIPPIALISTTVALYIEEENLRISPSVETSLHRVFEAPSCATSSIKMIEQISGGLPEGSI